MTRFNVVLAHWSARSRLQKSCNGDNQVSTTGWCQLTTYLSAILHFNFHTKVIFEQHIRSEQKRDTVKSVLDSDYCS